MSARAPTLEELAIEYYAPTRKGPVHEDMYALHRALDEAMGPFQVARVYHESGRSSYYYIVFQYKTFAVTVADSSYVPGFHLSIRGPRANAEEIVTNHGSWYNWVAGGEEKSDWTQDKVPCDQVAACLQAGVAQLEGAALWSHVAPTAAPSSSSCVLQ